MTESEKYDVLEKIGHGSFGVIRKVKRKTDGMVLCRKEISYLKMSQKEREQLHAEFQILSSLRHPNIVGYYHREHLKQSQDLHLYMEYCGKGDLGRIIKDLTRTNRYAEEEFVWIVFSQLVTALYRCHYGIDPPEVGKNVLSLGTKTKPKTPPGAMTILHRDLKPENVFIGDDNSVKLGDFGLSKMIQSHDFASTYVGTPFYMSPEICAAERYTLKSDIWSLGCVIYELCAREPPFNAKTHFQLVQKIKEGKVATLPRVYSSELMAVIRDCLKVNPDSRPDTAALLNLPVVRLMRMQREAVELKNHLRLQEASLDNKLKEVEKKMASVEADKVYARQEIESRIRREWEVKARLEIDRLVNDEIERLQQRFDAEVQAKVQEEMQKEKSVSFGGVETIGFASSAKSEYPHSIAGGSTDGEFPSTTDITEFSTVDSPEEAPLKKSGRAPFGRAQTMFERNFGTPMDLDMASPSPMAIASLSLSPRRNGATKAPALHPPNIFDEADNEARRRARRESDPVLSESEDDDDTPVIPSPTRPPRGGPNKNPFTTAPPQLNRMQTAPAVGHHQQQQKPARIGMTIKAVSELPLGTHHHHQAAAQLLRAVPSAGALRERGNSPNRHISKIPSASGLVGCENYGLARKPSLPSARIAAAMAGGGGKDLDGKAALKSGGGGGIPRGRTLVELHRTGGSPKRPGTTAAAAAYKTAATVSGGSAGSSGSAGLEPAAVWDPEFDDMPSPFLRRKAVARV
ncbi:protein kinase-like domain-containing protein [Xylariomycetidae sp. FL0641]|nr:protein kinase-like domain-containing protein [Xylariomycetidae sp. FL0641]